ncbi:MAG: SOS response-associated peptidase [Acidobacteria bacterium]|nr:MAG: SOS response-associated peptidase [Acidobacteriota bacterium]
MCGRYTLSSPTDLLADLLELDSVPDLAPRYNIAPTQEAAVVRVTGETGARTLDLLRWGLIPFWSKDPGIGNRMINARAETVGEKPAYRTSFKRKRCLVPADGFYEWQATGGPKQPFYFRFEGGGPFALAGLWDRWEKGEGDPIETFTILTTEPNEVVAPVHRRMPVILDRETMAIWLDPAIEDAERLTPLLGPFPAAGMEGFPVSTFVNSPGNDTPRCIEPLTE